jgi:hypothetical protein
MVQKELAVGVVVILKGRQADLAEVVLALGAVSGLPGFLHGR